MICVNCQKSQHKKCPGFKQRTHCDCQHLSGNMIDWLSVERENERRQRERDDAAGAIKEEPEATEIEGWPSPVIIHIPG